MKLCASLLLGGESQPRADKAMETAGDGWYQANFDPPSPGAYLAVVSGPEVEKVEDAFVVAEIPR